MRFLKSAVVAALALCASAAFATDPNIVFAVSATPDSVTLSRASLPTFAAYQVHIKNDSPYQAGSVKFKAKTAVVGSYDIAPFASADGANCTPTYPAPSTAIVCEIGYLPGHASVSFTITFAAPENGTRIELASQTFHRRTDLTYPPLVESEVLKTITHLVAPNPLQVATFLPQSSGGTVFTGSNGGVTLTSDTATTTVDVPRSSTVVIDETGDPTPPICPGVPVCPPNVSQLTIPGTFDRLTITLRIDVTAIPTKSKGPKGKSDDDDDEDDDKRGSGSGKKVSIKKAKVYYQADPTAADPQPQPAEVLDCSVTGGPFPGTPCIASRTAYKKKHAPSPDLAGDWEFVIFALENGRYFF